MTVDLPRPSRGWADRAACRGEDLVLFFGPDRERPPARNARENQAKRVCAACPIRAACLQEALDADIRDGVWGGLTGRERKAEAARRAANPDGPHRLPPVRYPRFKQSASRPRVKCPVCRRSTRLQLSGVLVTHTPLQGGGECVGSRQLPHALELQEAS